MLARSLLHSSLTALALIWMGGAVLVSGLEGQSRPEVFADADAERLVEGILAKWAAQEASDSSQFAEILSRAQVGLLIPNQWNWRRRTLFHREMVESIEYVGETVTGRTIRDRTRGAPLIGNALMDRPPVGEFMGFDPEEDSPPLLGLIGLGLSEENTGTIEVAGPGRISFLDSVYVDPLSGEGPEVYRFGSAEPLTVSDPAPRTLVTVVFETRDPESQRVVGVVFFDPATENPVRTVFRPIGRWETSAGLRGFSTKLPLVQKRANGEMDFLVIDYEDQQSARPIRARARGTMYWFWDQGIMPLELDIVLDRSHLDASTMDTVAPEVAPVGIIDMGQLLDLAPYLDRLKLVAGPPPYPTARKTITGALASVRFNQVQGANFRIRYPLPLGSESTLDMQLDIPTSGYQLTGSMGFRQTRVLDTRGVEGYSRLQDANWMEIVNGVGGSFNALFTGYDDGNYYLASGGRIWTATQQRPWYGEAEVFLEQQTAAPKTVTWSVFAPDTTEAGRPPDIEVDEGTYFGARTRMDYQWGMDAQRGVLLVRVYGQAATGEKTYGSIGTTTDLVGPLPGPFAGALRVNMAASAGNVPGQALYYLGGTKTIRGYPAAFQSGESMFITTAEIGTAIPLVRLVAFADLGYAGPVRELFDEEPLFAMGGGLSIGDGMLRLDLAKGLTDGGVWRLHIASSGLF